MVREAGSPTWVQDHESRYEVSAGKFTVNWDDPGYPRIERVAHGGVRFADAKREIYDALYEQIDDLRYTIAAMRRLKARDVEDAEDYDQFDEDE
jgi:hypothetical protein